jgi:protein-S-isoprenylcysteine O-methyltransferase Ste14
MSEDLLWQILFYLWVGGEVIISVATRTRSGQGSQQDKGTQIVLWIAIVTSFTAGGFATIITSANIAFNHQTLSLIALALLVAGLFVRLIAIITLGRAFSANVAIRDAQTMQRSGLYNVVRHPSYLGMELIFVAAGLHSHNWLSMAIICVLPTLAVLHRIRVEEAALLGAFGPEYSEYMKTTKRLIPGVY